MCHYDGLQTYRHKCIVCWYLHRLVNKDTRAVLIYKR